MSSPTHEQLTAIRIQYANLTHEIADINEQLADDWRGTDWRRRATKALRHKKRTARQLSTVLASYKPLQGRVWEVAQAAERFIADPTDTEALSGLQQAVKVMQQERP